MPMFKESTDTLLANPELLEKAVIEGCSAEHESEGKQMIKLDLGIGVFDVNGETCAEEEIKQESMPKVRRLSLVSRGSSGFAREGGGVGGRLRAGRRAR